MKKVTTQKDIAEALHIGQMTVYRALHDKGSISPKLQKRILDYADRVGYQTNLAAQALVQGVIKRIVLFSTDSPDFFWDHIGKGIQLASKQIRPFNYFVDYIRLPQKDTEKYLETLHTVISEGVDIVGIVNNETYDMKAIFSMLEKNKVPYVLFNIDAEHSKRLCYIGPDYVGSGCLAGEFLGKTVKKHADLLVISDDIAKSKQASRINGQRLDGFLQTIHRKYPLIHSEVLTLDTKQTKSSLMIEIFQKLNTEYDGIYLIPPLNQLLMDVLNKKGAPFPNVVLHDTFPGYETYFAKNMISAIIFQNPIQQGFYVVKVLEQILKSGCKPHKDIQLIQELILSENCQLYKNQLAFAEIEFETENT
ncbi:MAG: substrate-binding domain-containing protein [Spirochaetia bacterium]|jgi:LacI family transcriptional regulator|nr:substrate-binding domain-containing protein [Spirochaetia bacterium]